MSTARDVAVRPAQHDDNAETWPLARVFATSFTLQRAAFDATWARIVENPAALLLVAEEAGGAIVGYLMAHVHHTFLANGPVVWVEEVMVEEGGRRSGIGRSLMAGAEQWAASLGAAYVALASRRAGRFYDALGYEDSATYFRKTFT